MISLEIKLQLLFNRMAAKAKQGGKKERRRAIKDSEKEFLKNKRGKMRDSQIIMPLLQQIPLKIWLARISKDSLYFDQYVLLITLPLSFHLFGKKHMYCPYFFEVISMSWSLRQAQSLKPVLQVRISHCKIIYFPQNIVYFVLGHVLPKPEYCDIQSSRRRKTITKNSSA